HLGAIEQDADEVDLGMFAAAAGKTMLQRDRAHGVAVQALLDALLHRVVRLVVGSGHWLLARFWRGCAGCVPCLKLLPAPLRSRQTCYNPTRRLTNTLRGGTT